MTDPKGIAPKTGTPRPQEQDRTSPAEAREDADNEATPSVGENQAGYLKDRDLAPGGKASR